METLESSINFYLFIFCVEVFRYTALHHFNKYFNKEKVLCSNYIQSMLKNSKTIHYSECKNIY